MPIPSTDGRTGQFFRLPLLTRVLLVLLNGIVLVNAFLHNSKISYDGGAHRDYYETLAAGHLPTPHDSREYFSPPLSYLPAAALVRLGCTTDVSDKTWQFLNVFYSVVLTWHLAQCFCWLLPRAVRFSWLPLLLLGLFPVYYRSFAMPRGEPLLATLAVVALWHALRLVHRPDYRAIDGIILGVLGGLLVLTRQWGFFLLPALFTPFLLRLWREKNQRPAEWRKLALAMGAFLLLAVPYYAHLKIDYGSLTAFNRPRRGLSINRLTGYFREKLITLEGLKTTFRDPVRPSLAGLSIPILYSDTWGDYWEFFLVVGYDLQAHKPRQGVELADRIAAPDMAGKLLTNRVLMSAWLARINLLALIPTGLCLAALIAAAITVGRSLRRGDFLAENNPALSLALLLLLIGTTAAGYLWFDNSCRTSEGDTIKATYIVQIFPIMALVAAWAGVELRERHPVTYRAFLIAICLVTAVLAPNFITRCNPWFLSSLR